MSAVLVVLVSGASCPGETRGLHQSTAEAGGAGNAVFPPPGSFSAGAVADPSISLGTEALYTVSDPAGGAPPGAQERGTLKAGAAAGETAVNRGRGRRTMPALLKVSRLVSCQFEVLLFSHQSLQFSLFCTSLKKKLGSHCKRNQVLVYPACGWT